MFENHREHQEKFQRWFWNVQFHLVPIDNCECRFTWSSFEVLIAVSPWKTKVQNHLVLSFIGKTKKWDFYTDGPSSNISNGPRWRIVNGPDRGWIKCRRVTFGRTWHWSNFFSDFFWIWTKWRCQFSNRRNELEKGLISTRSFSTFSITVIPFWITVNPAIHRYLCPNWKKPYKSVFKHERIQYLNYFVLDE